MERDILLEALKLVIMAAGLIITRYIIPYLKARTDAEKTYKAMRYIREGVRAAEQIYAQADGKEKKAYVLRYAKLLTGRIGLDLSQDELEMLIEAAVRTMNSESLVLEPCISGAEEVIPGERISNLQAD